MENNKNEVISTSPSKLDIYTKLLDIAGKYTDIENVDYLKTGLFGYVTESMAMMMRDSSYHRAMLYNESFLNTAIIPQSVYNWAKMFNIEVAKATPAYATIKIIISSENMDQLTTLGNTTVDKEKYGGDIPESGSYFIIDKSNMIVAGEYYFSLEHSILVKKLDNNKSSYKASYIISENETTSFQSIGKRKNLSIIMDGENYEIEARAYQYRTTRIERQMSGTRMLNKVQLFNFEDQFAGAKLYYSENSLSKKKEVKLLYSNIGNKGDENVAYYNLNSNNELEITFRGGSEGFIPSPNSKISLEIYTTKGTNVPNNFTGTAVFKFNSGDNLRKYGIVISFEPTNIIGGADVPTTEKIKQTVIKQLSTCNTIVTNSDLNNYFEILTGLLESINDGKVTFVKRRDDILRRVFNAYVLLRDGIVDNGESVDETNPSFISKCIPTNTISATFPASMFGNENHALIYPRIKIDSDTQTYAGYETNDNTDTDYYFSPFYIFVQLSPVKKIKYIYNLTDNSSSLSAIKDDIAFDSGKYINPISVRVYRMIDTTAKAEPQYHFVFKFSTNIDSILNYNPTLLFGNNTLSNSNTVKHEEYDEEKKILTISMAIPVDDNEFLFSEKGMTIKIGDKNSLPESGVVKLELTGISNSSSKTLYESDDPLYLFRSLDEIMLSDISVNTKANETDPTLTEITGITIHDIPVVHSSYINSDSNNQDKFVKQLFTYITLLKENLEKLETSTFFDLKFYNTYGPSQLYNTTTTNLNLELVIHLNNDAKSLQTELRSYIRRAVDISNSDESFKVSRIISMLNKDETYGQYINYIEFRGLNGTFSQYIDKRNASEESIRDYPPEWLNIDASKLGNIEFVVD